MTAECWHWRQVKPASFINKLFQFFSLPAVFVKCSLYIILPLTQIAFTLNQSIVTAIRLPTVSIINPL